MPRSAGTAEIMLRHCEGFVLFNFFFFFPHKKKKQKIQGGASDGFVGGKEWLARGPVPLSGV